ncbi:MAG: MobA/MobL family protein [Oscillospiraceae bacterium]|nr:MobA/MobL family protein [Oscillospiraceae bacterium]
MAIYHLSVKIGGRAKGQSAIVASAYRSGEKLKNDETGITSNYDRKQRIVCCGVTLCENAPREYGNREILWNAVHKIEKSKNARLWREIEVALPRELTQDEQIDTIREFINYLTKKGMCADWAIHDSGDGNPHAHIMLTTRSILPDGKWAGKSRKVYELDENGHKIFQKVDKTGRKQYKCHTESYNDWNAKERVEEWRAVWAKCCNTRLSEQDRIDHRSYERQGKEQIPTIHEGYFARKIASQGRHSELVSRNDTIRQQNNLLEKIGNQVNAIELKIQQLTTELHSVQQDRIHTYLSHLQAIGFEFPKPNSNAYTEMYAKLVQNLQKSGFLTLQLARECAVNSPKLCRHRVIGKEQAQRFVTRLKEKNIAFLVGKSTNNKIYTYVANGTDIERIRQIVLELRSESQSESSRTRPGKPKSKSLSQENIANIIQLKNDYAFKCSVYYYLKTTHISTECQESYQNAQQMVQEFRQSAEKVQDLNDKIKKTINPFKKKHLRKERDNTAMQLERASHSLQSALDITLIYDGNALDCYAAPKDHIHAIIRYTKHPIRIKKDNMDSEIKRNKVIQELMQRKITDEDVQTALKLFQNACKSVPDAEQQKLYVALTNDKVPNFDFEVRGYLSKGRQIATENITKIVSSLKPGIPSYQSKQVHEQEQKIESLTSHRYLE